MSSLAVLAVCSRDGSVSGSVTVVQTKILDGFP